MKLLYLTFLFLFSNPVIDMPTTSSCLDGTSLENTLIGTSIVQWGGCGNFLLATNILGTCSIHMQLSQDPGSDYNIFISPYMNGFCPGGSVGDNGSTANCISGITNKIQYGASVVVYINFGSGQIPMQYINESGITSSPYCCFA